MACACVPTGKGVGHRCREGPGRVAAGCRVWRREDYRYHSSKTLALYCSSHTEMCMYDRCSVALTNTRIVLYVCTPHIQLHECNLCEHPKASEAVLEVAVGDEG